jgi:fructose-1,6-bisphosphatase/inositol monophosphatase family enzyme
VCGVPFYGVLIAFEAHGEVPLGVVNFPALNEMVSAMRGEGCYWNGRRAQVSSVSNLSEATLLLTDFYQMEKVGYATALRQLCAATKMQRTWGDVYGHVLVATGRAEIMLDPLMHVWDCGPLLPILTEAGGRFTDWNGVATIHGENAFSTNGPLHQNVQNFLRRDPSAEQAGK